MSIQQLSNGTPDGVKLGSTATELVGFYDLATPIAQPSVTAVVATATTGTNEAACTRILAALVNLGLVVTTAN